MGGPCGFGAGRRQGRFRPGRFGGRRAGRCFRAIRRRGGFRKGGGLRCRGRLRLFLLHNHHVAVFVEGVGDTSVRKVVDLCFRPSLIISRVIINKLVVRNIQECRVIDCRNVPCKNQCLQLCTVLIHNVEHNEVQISGQDDAFQIRTKLKGVAFQYGHCIGKVYFYQVRTGSKGRASDRRDFFRQNHFLDALTPCKSTISDCLHTFRQVQSLQSRAT